MSPFKKKNPVSIVFFLILALVAFVLGGTLLFWSSLPLKDLSSLTRQGDVSQPDSQKQSDNDSSDNAQQSPKKPFGADGKQVQGWIYPGPETCGVEQELKQGLRVEVLKPEYFALANDGSLRLLLQEDVGCNGYSSDHVALMKQYSAEQYVTISGRLEPMRLFFGSGKTSDAVAELSRFVMKNNLSGIELDFEDFSGWTPQDYQDYLKFVEDLGTALENDGKGLLVAGPPVSNQLEESYYPWRYRDFANLPVKQVVVMAYDYQADQGNGVPVAPNEWVTGIVDYMKKNVGDVSRFSIGIPAYGYTGKPGEYTAKLLTRQQAQSHGLFSRLERDPNSFELIAQSENEVLVSQDALTLQMKSDLLFSLGVQSVSIWHLGGNDWVK